MKRKTRQSVAAEKTSEDVGDDVREQVLGDGEENVGDANPDGEEDLIDDTIINQQDSIKTNDAAEETSEEVEGPVGETQQDAPNEDNLDELTGNTDKVISDEPLEELQDESQGGIPDEPEEEAIVEQEDDAEGNSEEESKNVNEDEIEGIRENPLFSPDASAEPGPIESFTLEGDGEALDFEPEENEATNKPDISQESRTEKEGTSWLDNVASPGNVESKDENNIVIDEIIISDSEDINELGDKIDAAYPGTKDTDTNIRDDDESDEEKRGWRSEKPKNTSETTSGRNRRTSPVRRRRVSPPVSRSRPKRRSRSSSIEIVSVRSQSKSPEVVKRREKLPTGRFLSRSRSRERYRRRSLTPPRRKINQLREEREKTERVRRQVENLRDMVSGGGGGVKSRLGNPSPPQKKERGHKLIVKNFPSSMSDSEFYSMFIRKGELVSCQKKNNIGFVVYKTRESANNALTSLNGTKNGNLTLSVREAPPERDSAPAQPPRQSQRYQEPPIVAPPPPTGIFSRLGSGHNRNSEMGRESVYDGRYEDYSRLNRPGPMFDQPTDRFHSDMSREFSRSEQMMSRQGERFHSDRNREFRRSEQMLDLQDDRFNMEFSRDSDYADRYDSFQRHSRPQIMDLEDERFHNDMMQDEMQSRGFQDRMTSMNSGRMSANMSMAGNMMGSSGNMGSMMSGTIRGRMGSMMAGDMGGNYRGDNSSMSGYGQTRMEEDVGLGAASMGGGMGSYRREPSGYGGFNDMGGQLGVNRNFGQSSAFMIEEQEDEDYRRGFLTRSNLNTAGRDRDLRPSVSVRDDFESNSGHFVIGGKSEPRSQQASWAQPGRERVTFGSTGYSGGNTGRNGGRHSTWSN